MKICCICEQVHKMYCCICLCGITLATIITLYVYFGLVYDWDA